MIVLLFIFFNIFLFCFVAEEELLFKNITIIKQNHLYCLSGLSLNPFPLHVTVEPLLFSIFLWNWLKKNGVINILANVIKIQRNGQILFFSFQWNTFSLQKPNQVIISNNYKPLKNACQFSISKWLSNQPLRMIDSQKQLNVSDNFHVRCQNCDRSVDLF